MSKRWNHYSGKHTLIKTAVIEHYVLNTILSTYKNHIIQFLQNNPISPLPQMRKLGHREVE